MSTTEAVRLSSAIIADAGRMAKLNFRSVPKQLDYWISIGRAAEMNPDLPLNFIRESLLAKAEIEQGLTESFVFKKGVIAK